MTTHMISPARIVRGDFGGDKVRIIALNPRNRERYGMGDTMIGPVDLSTLLASGEQAALNAGESALASGITSNPAVQAAAASGAQNAAAGSLASWLIANQMYLMIGGGVLAAGILAMLFMPKRG